MLNMGIATTMASIEINGIISGSQIGGEFSKTENAVKEEANVIANSVLVIGIVIVALLFMFGKRDIAMKAGMCVAIGYIIISKVDIVVNFFKGLIGL